jgi:ABC-2 type transport system permease protein
MRVLVGLAYRFEVFATLASNLILLIATIFLWRATYRGIGEVDGVNQSQMITFAIIGAALNSLFATGVQDTILARVRQGTIAIDFIRPYNPFTQWLAQDVGAAISASVTHALPLLLVGMALVQAPWPASGSAAMFFVPSCVLSYGILWILSALTGLAAFWFLELGNIGFVKDATVKLLSGSIVPIWFWPKRFQAISQWLPFKYAFQTPLGIYIGKIRPAEAAGTLLLQAVWILVLGVVLAAVSRAATRKLIVQGG